MPKEDLDRAWDEAEEFKRKINMMPSGKFRELVEKKLAEVLEKKYGVPFKKYTPFSKFSKRKF